LPGFQIVAPGQTPVISFIVNDAETPVGDLLVTASSSNTNLVPNANIAFGGSGTNRPVQITPVAGRTGVAVIKLRLTDARGAFVGFQSLGSWAKPFNGAHVDNDLNGSPEDGLDYGFNIFRCRYFEVYQADMDFANYAAEFQRWHDFLAALPAPPVMLNLELVTPASLRADFSALAGHSYVMESSTNLVSWMTYATWTNLASTNATISVALPTTNLSGFFRVRY
jgi:hypothetical protein